MSRISRTDGIQALPPSRAVEILVGESREFFGIFHGRPFVLGAQMTAKAEWYSAIPGPSAGRRAYTDIAAMALEPDTDPNVSDPDLSPEIVDASHGVYRCFIRPDFFRPTALSIYSRRQPELDAERIPLAACFVRATRPDGAIFIDRFLVFCRRGSPIL